jgi:hypothetical protein
MKPNIETWVLADAKNERGHELSLMRKEEGGKAQWELYWGHQRVTELTDEMILKIAGVSEWVSKRSVQ